jgi:hypothetical protein
MVTIDIKKLLRDERQSRIKPVAAAAQDGTDEASECSLSGEIILTSFAVGADKLSVLRSSCLQRANTQPRS